MAIGVSVSTVATTNNEPAVLQASQSSTPIPITRSSNTLNLSTLPRHTPPSQGHCLPSPPLSTTRDPFVDSSSRENGESVRETSRKMYASLSPPLFPLKKSSSLPITQHRHHYVCHRHHASPKKCIMSPERLLSLQHHHSPHCSSFNDDLLRSAAVVSAEELGRSWQPDFVVAKRRHHFACLSSSSCSSSGHASLMDSESGEECEEDELDKCTAEACPAIRHHRHGLATRLPRGTIRWLRQAPDTVRLIESIVSSLHSSSSPSSSEDDNIMGDDSGGSGSGNEEQVYGLQLTSAFHRAVLHAVSRYWGARSWSTSCHRRNSASPFHLHHHHHPSGRHHACHSNLKDAEDGELLARITYVAVRSGHTKPDRSLCDLLFSSNTFTANSSDEFLLQSCISL